MAFQTIAKVFLLAFTLTAIDALAQPTPAKASPPPSPDLRDGGAAPSSISDRAVTQVALRGHHLTDATVTVNGPCKLVSSKVVSDSELQLWLEGQRDINDAGNTCRVRVRVGKLEVSTALAVTKAD
jgi:hypothetical protein